MIQLDKENCILDQCSETLTAKMKDIIGLTTCLNTCQQLLPAQGVLYRGHCMIHL